MIKRFSSWLYSRTHKEGASPDIHVANKIRDPYATSPTWQKMPINPGMTESEPDRTEYIKYEFDKTVDIDQIRKLVDTYRSSQIVSVSEHLDHILIHSNLAAWEVELLSKTLKKFEAKYKSPLSGALK